MPVWQQIYESEALSDNNIEILSVAMDVQGADAARPFVDNAGATFETVVDRENILGQQYRFKAIPNGYLINSDGTVEYRRLGGFDIRRAETRQIVEDWIDRPAAPAAETPEVDAMGDEHDQANSLFRQGEAAYRTGDAARAIELWRRAVELEPDNFIIRKQIWALENPEKFYDSDVDYAWQCDQMQLGR